MTTILGPRDGRPLREIEYDLLRRFMLGAPAQPATNLWRAVELPVLAAALPKNGRGLDCGCGDGVLTGILRDLVGSMGGETDAPPNWDLVGVDPDPAEIELARRSGVYSAVHATGASAMPFPDGAFDFAFANSVLEHIPDLPASLAEIARCLRPGGVLLATVPAPSLHVCLAGPDWTWRANRAEYLRQFDERVAHVNYWDAERWRDELERAGLSLENAAGYLLRRQVQRWEFWSNCTGGTAL